ncbi:MAG: hypothetical protein DI613_09845 [Kocuria rhizophila]|uniref:hypothetical protein n=1 Tax=Kocuria carniphila TaxID=262208 RepID=UPI000DAF5AD2|nr:MAG: hypothetical protein DI613_09845 [Kocuria rhizophila]
MDTEQIMIRSLPTMTTEEIETLVTSCCERGHGLHVILNEGPFILSGEDLRSTWDDLAPGETFRPTALLEPRATHH